jgi:glycosyltransferase involved in cell wall biosynthesis
MLINKRDSKALESAMKNMMLNPNLVSQMGEYAYQRAVSLFCAKNITDSWLKLYESIVPVELV